MNPTHAQARERARLQGLFRLFRELAPAPGCSERSFLDWLEGDGPADRDDVAARRRRAMLEGWLGGPRRRHG